MDDPNMHEYGNDEQSLPPEGHPLRKLGIRLAELLDEDHWAHCEGILLDGWAAGAKERAALEGLPNGAIDGGWTAAGMSAYAKKLEDALGSIIQYGSDTLSGRVGGPDDRTWQREAVLEMTMRARIALGHNVQIEGQPAVGLSLSNEGQMTVRGNAKRYWK